MLRDYVKYVLSLVAIVVFMLILSLIIGCAGNTPKDTSTGKFRVLETWGNKRYSINQQYKQDTEHASKVYAAYMFKVYRETEDFTQARNIANAKYQESMQKARNTLQLRLMGLNTDKSKHWNKLYSLKSIPKHDTNNINHAKQGMKAWHAVVIGCLCGLVFGFLVFLPMYIDLWRDR